MKSTDTIRHSIRTGCLILCALGHKDWAERFALAWNGCPQLPHPIKISFEGYKCSLSRDGVVFDEFYISGESD